MWSGSKRGVTVLGYCCLALLCASATVIHAKSKTSTYRGAWFRIEYSSTFKVRPSMKSATSSKGHDSAFFTSPDKSVEFYVFSPQWNGEPKDIALDKKTEKETARKTRRKGSVRTTWITIRAVNGAYTRSILDIEDTERNTRHAFAIKYKDKKIYDAHKAEYTKFKASLVQFAD